MTSFGGTSLCAIPICGAASRSQALSASPAAIRAASRTEASAVRATAPTANAASALTVRPAPAIPAIPAASAARSAETMAAPAAVNAAAAALAALRPEIPAAAAASAVRPPAAAVIAADAPAGAAAAEAEPRFIVPRPSGRVHDCLQTRRPYRRRVLIVLPSVIAARFRSPMHRGSQYGCFPYFLPQK